MFEAVGTRPNQGLRPRFFKHTKRFNPVIRKFCSPRAPDESAPRSLVVQIKNNRRPGQLFSPKAQTDQERQDLKLINRVGRGLLKLGHHLCGDSLRKERNLRTMLVQKNPTNAATFVSHVPFARTIREYQPRAANRPRHLHWPA